MTLIFLAALAVRALVDETCDASTYSQDLGNTHCPFLSASSKAASPQECMQACCDAGDACETWNWCDPGQACATGFWAQPGALSRGADLPGWPRNATVPAAMAACGSSDECIGLTYHAELHPAPSTLLKIYLKTAGSGAVKDPSWSRRIKASAGCFTGRLDPSCANASAGWRSRALPPRPLGPCDILDAAGTPCVAAHSIARALYANYTGPLYRVLRATDEAGLDIGPHHNGFARATDQDAFCANASCYILRIFDQSPHGNHLDTAPAGGACHYPLSPTNASRERISLRGGHAVYGAYFEGQMGYRIDRTSGVATGEQPQMMCSTRAAAAALPPSC